MKKEKTGRRINVGWFRMVLADFLPHPIVQKRLKQSWMAIIDEIKMPVAILDKYPRRKKNVMLPKIKLGHIYTPKRQAKNTKMNCPAHRPSQPPPFPRTLPTPFFKI